QFEKILKEKWNEATDFGLFKYSLKNLKSKVTVGRKQFVLQLNEKRFSERRIPYTYNSCIVPFDDKEFNFNKVLPGEILFEFKCASKDITVSKCGETDVVLINNSPLEKFHVLLIPAITQCTNQKITKELIEMCLNFILLCPSKGWRIGFNSLCGFASVNHQHAHAWKLKLPLFIESAPVLHVKDDFYILNDSSNHAIAFQLDGDNVTKLIRHVCDCAIYLQNNEIPHNLFITRGSHFNFPLRSTIRIFIWLRKKFVASAQSKGFNVACAELAGHIPVYGKM
ncbi:hypothetical protein HELRODRAFT_90313, partial [Helobdella robusta]|uniref:GDP-D-glucose phosphorylase 1 n=1 Tax=Helobdella robusta TaxID=6412 RepID=T1G7P2_HELRO